jgi:DNA mismatch repair protein MutL
MVADLLAQLVRAEGISMGELLEESLARMACKAAVKAGEKLSAEEVVALLRAGELADNPFHCPHGRPTIWKITRKELDRRFLRG